MKPSEFCCALGIALSLMCAAAASAFETDTHVVLSERAVGAAGGLTAFLNADSGEFPKGLDQLVDGWVLRDLVADGSISEDDFPRYFRHFHDPTKDWSAAGLAVGLDSSIVWAQTQSADQGYAWQDARETYLLALTGVTNVDRQANYADTFRSLGHLIHLIQDAATPAHARNDPHANPNDYLGLPNLIVGADGFHAYAATAGLSVIELMPSSAFVYFDPTILNITPANTLAPIPIARIWDTTDDASRPSPDWLTDVGIAQYSNAKFLSDDRLFDAYTDPNPQDLLIQIESVAPLHAYMYFRSGKGETDYRVASLSAMAEFLPPGYITDPPLDAKVLADYGTKLFPRAIGYSAGLINYFFRGTVGIQAPTRYVYGLAEYKANNSSAFTKIKAQVSNTSPAGEETSGPGTAWAVLRYRTPTDSSDLFVNPCANLSDPPTYTASAPVTVALGRSPIELTFDFSSSPIPTNSADLFMYVVYQGTLGLEDNAVLVGTKDLYEPFPLDHGNTTDYDCYKNQLYPQTCAAGTANNTQPPIRCPYYPANDPGRDVDPNNPGLELIGPVTDQMQFVKTGPYNSWPRPSTTNFDYEMDTDDYAQFGRYVLIQDSPWYDVASLVQTQQVVTQSTPNHDVYDVWSLTGDVNDIQTAPDGGTTRRCTSNFTYRGWDTFVIFLRITRSIPEWQPVCLPNSAGKGPNIARVNGTLTPQ